MLTTLVTVVVSTITTPCLGLVSHGLYSLTPAPYLHKQVQYITVQYSTVHHTGHAAPGRGVHVEKLLPR